MTRRGRQRKQREAITQEPLLQSGQQVMKVVSVRGQNLYDLCDEHGNVQVFDMPARLRHVVFAKPGTFVFARVDTTRAQGAIKGDIEVVILDHFLNSLQKANFWPESFAATTPANRVTTSDSSHPCAQTLSNSQAPLDKTEEEEEEENDDWLAAGNPNRASWARFEVSSEENSSAEKEE